MKFKVGDYVKSKENGYILVVLDIDGDTFKGMFATPHPNNNKIQIGDVYSCVSFEYFELCENPNVKVVRKWEDLIGLENGKGLVIDREGTVEAITGIGFSYTVIRKSLLSTKTYCKILRSMGFEFEYKPMRTVEEVIGEMREKEVPFVVGEYNYYVRKWHGEGEKPYFEIHWGKRGYMLGTIYLREEDAEKYVEELNEIVNQ